jgi:hypothetical protein
MGKSSGKVTSARVARAASKVLRDGRTSKASKSVAGSALAQRPSSGKKK